MEEHNGYMAKLNSLPLQERAESSLLEKATSLLFCQHHMVSYLSDELENARQKFRDAVSEEAKKKKEEERVQVCGSVMQMTIIEVLIWTPTTRAPETLLVSRASHASRTPLTAQAPPAPTTRAPRTLPAPPDPPTPPVTLQSTDEFPSESDSESDSDSEDEEQGTGTVDPWMAYQARWKDITDNEVKGGIVSIKEGIPNPSI